MIRPYNSSSDESTVVSLVQQDKHMKAEEIIERLNNTTAWVFDDGGIKGCGAATNVNDSAYGKRIDFWIYTGPQYRRQGIGRALYKKALQYIEEHAVDIVVTGYRSDNGDAEHFFSKRGLNYWFSSHLMAYTGPSFPGTNQKLEAYREEFFDDLLTIRNEAFAQLRRENNIVPIYCYPPGFDRAKVYQELNSLQNNIHLLVRDGRLVAFAEIQDDYIDTIAVSPHYQRQGLGRELTKYCINTLRKGGASTIYLGVVDTNKGARKLYESLGFEFVETHAFAKKN